jgi:hypothetical protein
MLLEDLVASARVHLIGVAVVPALGPSRPHDPWSAGGALAMADRGLFAQRAGLLRPVDSGAWAHDHGVPLEVLEPEVLLDLTGRDQSHTAAGFVVWRLHGVRVCADDWRPERDAVVRAVLMGSSTIEFELEETAAGGFGDRRVTTCVCPTHPSSPLLTDAYLAASARQLIARRLATFSLARPEPGDPQDTQIVAAQRPRVGRAAAAQAPPPSFGPTATAAVRLLGRTIARQVRKAVWEQQWFLMIGRRPADVLLPDPRGLEMLLPPPGRYWADPHVVQYEGRTHVFFEEFLYAERKGRIAVTTLDSGGRPGPVQVALDLDSHLSYPDVFVHDGRLFMIPEGASSGRVDLYECLGGPRDWAFRRTLLADTPLVDVSVVEWQGRWWLFGSLKKPAGLRTAELLLLYSAEDPVTGVWREHRLSPLLADVRRTAGGRAHAHREEAVPACPGRVARLRLGHRRQRDPQAGPGRLPRTQARIAPAFGRQSSLRGAHAESRRRHGRDGCVSLGET